MDRADLTGAPWRKSSYSNGQAECVEVAPLADRHVATRDTKAHGHGPALIFTTHQWQTFQAGVRDCALDQP
ncbi:DUF397 domain-containing protein [Streptomyces lichenis]|uniref:DUF397 domain-containing protein n=1 Tax=Streptomyces lichenis TaxID=2306967 RepID=A0ABT0I5N0_9ACTN|nr:DUF397 domain-containing protein [Streptomyces lichenis]MCK8676626.1 DUF397 domain-containing protein [Streptomyces lichenis]